MRKDFRVHYGRNRAEKIKVNKTELLSILESNRSKHRQIFEEACDGYQRAVIKELEAQLKRAKEGIRRSMFINIPAPVDQTKEYDRAIAMLKMSVEQEVFLSEQDFRCYFWTTGTGNKSS